MAINSNNMQSAPVSNGQPSASSTSGGSGKLLVYIIGAVAVIALIGLAYLLISSTSSNSTATQTVPVQVQNHSMNSTPEYMSAAQAQRILGPQVSGYYSADLFNPNSPLNISDIEQITPSLYGNVTSGWISSGSLVNASYNATLLFFVMKTGNQAGVAGQLQTSFASFFNMTPTTVNQGTYNGMSYTYGLYENSTSSVQMVTGWKGNNVALMILQSYPAYTVNETILVNTAANDTT